jgi:hypothetical protein
VKRGGHVKLTVEIEEVDAGVTTSPVIATYLRAMLTVRALFRAAGQALLEVERCRQKLKPAQLREAGRLLQSVGPPRRNRLVRRPSRRRARRKSR